MAPQHPHPYPHQQRQQQHPLPSKHAPQKPPSPRRKPDACPSHIPSSFAKNAEGRRQSSNGTTDQDRTSRDRSSRARTGKNRSGGGARRRRHDRHVAVDMLRARLTDAGTGIRPWDPSGRSTDGMACRHASTLKSDRPTGKARQPPTTSTSTSTATFPRVRHRALSRSQAQTLPEGSRHASEH